MSFLPPEYDSHKMFNFKPDMWTVEIKYIENLLLYISKPKKKTKILEWGAGNSSLYFSLFLTSMGVDFKWDAIENFTPWYKNV
ncbi:hypothetical protein LCGC14_2764310, partial [marine sediment metagenome]